MPALIMIEQKINKFSFFPLWIILMVGLTLTLSRALGGSGAAIEWQAKGREFPENMMDSAVYYLRHAAEQFALENDFNSQASTLNEIGNLYIKIRNFPKATEYYIAAAEIYRIKIDNRQMLGRTMINIAMAKTSVGNPDAALDYAQKGLIFSKELNDVVAIVFTQRLIGRIYRSKGMYDEAIAQVRQTLGFYLEQEDWSNLGESFQNIANIFYDKKEYGKAIAYSDSSILYNRKAGNLINIANSLHSLSFSFLMLNRLDEALAYSDSSIAAGKELADPYLVMDGYKVNANIMQLKNNIDGYSHYITLYLAQRDSIDNLQQASLTLELEARYQNQVKQAEIDVLLLEQQLLASNIRRQKNMRNGITFTLVIVIVFSLVLVNRFKVLNETRRQLEVEKLRNSIARDLHDDLGSALSSINIISEMALQNGNADFTNHFACIGKQSAQMMDKLSDIVWSINPDNDATAELVARMREFASEILEPKSVEWSLHVDDKINNIKLSLEKRKTIYLVFKEAINNAAKYSQTSTIEICLILLDQKLNVLIRDMGHGFDEALVKKGNGLRNMVERARLAGGTLSIISNTGKGTEVKLKIPIT
jgi:two-component system, NarL family, sensor histidine kinase UhpB